MENIENDFLYRYETNIDKTQLINLFKSVGWKTAEYPNRLYNAIKNSEYVMTVWKNENLVGLISAITDGYINVFITYLLVKPDNVKKVIDVLYNEPIINKKKLMEITNIRPSTLKDTVNVLLENNIIVETTGYSRNQVFAFQKYIDLFLK